MNNDTYISWGAGVNSTAIIARFLLGQLQGKPEIVFADTGGELPETYAYIEQVRSILETQGWTVTILRPFGSYKTLYTPKIRGKMLYDHLWDARTVPGFKWRYCTRQYKIDPLKKYQPGKTKLIGICADELRRIKEDAIYPVREYTREECKELIAEAGLPEAHKTGCWFCPFQPKKQWIELYETHPDLWQKAVDLEMNSTHWKYFNNGLSLEGQVQKWVTERELKRSQLKFRW
jgi:3'-phosphoadenosine 5'-phosphosulfate sulfotransferase (PAPS reductase)/FAD synthetase